MHKMLWYAIRGAKAKRTPSKRKDAETRRRGELRVFNRRKKGNEEGESGIEDENKDDVRERDLSGKPGTTGTFEFSEGIYKNIRHRSGTCYG